MYHGFKLPFDARVLQGRKTSKLTKKKRHPPLFPPLWIGLDGGKRGGVGNRKENFRLVLSFVGPADR